MAKGKDFKPARRVQIVVGGGTGYFKPGQYAYALGYNTSGGFYWIDRDGHSAPGDRAYLVSKTRDMRGGALWFSESGVRFTGRKPRK